MSLPSIAQMSYSLISVVHTALKIVNDTIGRHVVYVNMSSWTCPVNDCESTPKRSTLTSSSSTFSSSSPKSLIPVPFDVLQLDRSNANPNKKKDSRWYRCMIQFSDTEEKSFQNNDVFQKIFICWACFEFSDSYQILTSDSSSTNLNFTNFRYPQNICRFHGFVSIQPITCRSYRRKEQGDEIHR